VAMRGPLRVQFTRTFDQLHRLLGRPKVYVFPWQVPAGSNYDPTVDAWVDADGDVVSKANSDLTYYAVPALWGADANSFVAAMGGEVGEGQVVAVAKFEHRAKFDAAFMVVPGDLSGGARYTVRGLENAPDGESGVFVVANLSKK